jgi:hypothetical protein
MKSGLLKLAAVMSTLFFCFVSFSLVRFAGSEDWIRTGLVTAMGAGVIWGCISTWARIFVYERAGIQPQMKLFPGPRPTESIELRAWYWHRQFLAGFIVMICSGALISLSIWFRER